MQKRTRAEAKQWFRDQNLTVSDWARANGYNSVEVYRVLNGQSKCLYGRGKEIARKLNIELTGD
jgi:putative phage-related DNA-binding protein